MGNAPRTTGGKRVATVVLTGRPSHPFYTRLNQPLGESWSSTTREQTEAVSPEKPDELDQLDGEGPP